MHFMKYFLLTQRNKGNLQIRSCQLFIYYLEIYAKIVVKMPSVFFFCYENFLISETSVLFYLPVLTFEMVSFKIFFATIEKTTIPS